MRQASRKTDKWRNLWHDYRIMVYMIVTWLCLQSLIYFKYN
jgi:hypothetical protein